MQPVLRSVWEDSRPASPPLRVWRDWALVGALGPLAVVEGALRPGLPWRVATVVVVAALTQMRQMLQVLRRDEPAQLAPTPQIADLADLAGAARTGPPVEVEITGDVARVSPSVGAPVFRLAQEPVTNARRHARHATRIEVRVEADESVVHLRVREDGEAPPARPVTTPGYGLIGMVERAYLLGGSCQAGPDPVRGWTVTAVLPRTGSAP